jgi:hypothetical protein
VLFTADVTLPIAAASTSAIVAASTSAIVGNKLVNLKAWLLDEAIVKGKKVSGAFWEKLQIIEAKINGVKVPTVKFVITLGTFRYNRYNLGGKIPESGDEVAVAVANNALLALDDFVKFSYVASIGLSSISLLFNDNTLRETLATVRRGEVLKAVSDLRRQTEKLEDEIPVYKKKVKLLKRRVYDHRKKLELLKRRVYDHQKKLELFYMTLFFCIGMIIDFVYNRL